MKNVINFIKRKSTIILLIILAVIVVIAIVLVGMFLPKTERSVYGNRLEGIENVPVTDSLKNSIIDSIVATDKTTSATVTLTGKIIKISIKVKDEVSLEDAKAIYNSFKDNFTEEILAYYDIQVMLTNSNYSSFGYLKAGRNELKWTNNK